MDRQPSWIDIPDDSQLLNPGVSFIIRAEKGLKVLSEYKETQKYLTKTLHNISPGNILMMGLQLTVTESFSTSFVLFFFFLCFSFFLIYPC